MGISERLETEGKSFADKETTVKAYKNGQREGLYDTKFDESNSETDEYIDGEKVKPAEVADSLKKVQERNVTVDENGRLHGQYDMEYGKATEVAHYINGREVKNIPSRGKDDR